MEKKLNSQIIFIKNEINPLKVSSKRKTLTSNTHNFTVDSNNSNRNSYSKDVSKIRSKEISNYSKKNQNKINKTNNDNFRNTIRKITKTYSHKKIYIIHPKKDISEDEILLDKPHLEKKNISKKKIIIVKDKKYSLKTSS